MSVNDTNLRWPSRGPLRGNLDSRNLGGGSLRLIQHRSPSSDKDIAGLNSQASATQKNIDSLILECKAAHRAKEEALEINRRELTRLMGSIVTFMSKQSLAESVLKHELEARELMNKEIKKLRSNCELQNSNFGNQYQMLTRDVSRIQGMQGLAPSCPAGVLFVQWCSAEHESLLDPSMRPLHRVARTLETEFVQAVFQQTVVNASFRPFPQAPGSLHVGLLKQQDWPGQLGPNAQKNRAASRSCEYNADQKVNCAAFRVELRRMLGTVKEHQRKVASVQASQETSCKKREQQEETMATASKRRALEAGDALNRAMAEMASLQADRDAKLQTEEALKQDLKAKVKECKQRLAFYKVQLCDVFKLRQSVYERAGGDPHTLIQDCQVTDWTFMPCTKKCSAAGEDPGYMDGTRRELLPPSPNGMQCPPLRARLACGSAPCPRNCQMSEWSEWGLCSKKCGGGMQSRTRHAKVLPKNGGQVCPVQQELRDCGTGACDVDCALDVWTPWTSCSRACRATKDVATGRQYRRREVKQQPQGAGICPSRNSDERMQVRKCNPTLCPSNSSCHGDKDIILLLDGSDTANFTAQLTFARQLVQRSDSTMRFALVAYGTRTKVFARRAQDRDAVLTALEGAQAPGGFPDLAQGTAVVRTLLQSEAEEDREEIILMLTDGSPIDADMSVGAAKELKKEHVRVMVGFVDDHSKTTRLRMCSLASTPCAANVEAVDSWEQFSLQPERVLAALCTTMTAPHDLSTSSTLVLR